MFVNNNSLTSLNDLNSNSDCNSISNWAEKLSLSDISVGEILDTYKNDTDLLKHILAAKTEEDKVSSLYVVQKFSKSTHPPTFREEQPKKSAEQRKQDCNQNSLIYSLIRTAVPRYWMIQTHP